MPGEISTKSKDVSFQAIQSYTKDAAKGNLKGRLVIEGQGKDERITYQRLKSGQAEEMGRESLTPIRDFCSKHKIDCKKLDDISPSILEYRDVSRGQWDKGALMASMRKDALRESLLTGGNVEELEPPATLDEVKKLIEEFSYEDLCKGIDACRAKELSPFQKKVVPLLEQRELALAMESVKVYRNETKRDMTPNIMKQKESPWTNMGCRELLEWGIENRNDILVSALMRRITRAEAQDVVSKNPDNVWVDKYDKSIWLL
ncbi:MAG: hypothetical protein LLG04_15345 [Parachlamydia sp.]|nr:hypothetical protein [Parachlamydia sp.]